MRYLAAYMLCQLGGKEHPTATDLKSILESVGIESDADRMKQLLSAMEGKEVNQLIVDGSTKLSTVPMGGAVAAAPAVAAPAAAEAPKSESKPEKEAAKEESESEEDLGFGLFD